MTTAICFDVDGTLLQFDRPYDAVLSAVFEEHLGTASPDLIETYESAFQPAFSAREPEPTRQGMAAVVDSLGSDVDPETLVTALRTAEQRATTVPTGTRESLSALGEDNRLLVVTNGTAEWQGAKLAHHDLDGYFETVISAYDMGTQKPDRAVYDAVREQVDAEEYVMVGDDYEGDVEGARAAGFIPVHVEDDEDMAAFWATLRTLV